MYHRCYGVDPLICSLPHGVAPRGPNVYVLGRLAVGRGAVVGRTGGPIVAADPPTTDNRAAPARHPASPRCVVVQGNSVHTRGNTYIGFPARCSIGFRSHVQYDLDWIFLCFRFPYPNAPLRGPGCFRSLCCGLSPQDTVGCGKQ